MAERAGLVRCGIARQADLLRDGSRDDHVLYDLLAASSDRVSLGGQAARAVGGAMRRPAVGPCTDRARTAPGSGGRPRRREVLAHAGDVAVGDAVAGRPRRDPAVVGVQLPDDAGRRRGEEEEKDE